MHMLKSLKTILNQATNRMRWYNQLSGIGVNILEGFGQLVLNCPTFYFVCVVGFLTLYALVLLLYIILLYKAG